MRRAPAWLTATIAILHLRPRRPFAWLCAPEGRDAAERVLNGFTLLERRFMCVMLALSADWPHLRHEVSMDIPHKI